MKKTEWTCFCRNRDDRADKIISSSLSVCASTFLRIPATLKNARYENVQRFLNRTASDAIRVYRTRSMHVRMDLYKCLWFRVFLVRTRSALRKYFNHTRRIYISCNHQSNADLQIRIIRCYMFTVILYGVVETRTLSKVPNNWIQAFEMWIHIRVLKISWCDHMTNINVLERMNKEFEIVKTIKSRKLQYLGHSLLQLLILGTIVGKRSHGRLRISWLDNLKKWSNTSTILYIQNGQ
jgi:hypothetical protein